MTLAGIRDYFELVKFSHTLFALPFALLGATLAAYAPDSRPARLQDWLGILLCMAAARSAGAARAAAVAVAGPGAEQRTCQKSGSPRAAAVAAVRPPASLGGS